MQCPKCNEGNLKKIRFITSGKNAYLCDCCNSFWFSGEEIKATSGHVMDENAKDKTVPEGFVYLNEQDQEYQAGEDEKQRESYEKS